MLFDLNGTQSDNDFGSASVLVSSSFPVLYLDVWHVSHKTIHDWD
jgi:hypothetical protein